jgi:hypothetical protein
MSRLNWRLWLKISIGMLIVAWAIFVIIIAASMTSGACAQSPLLNPSNPASPLNPMYSPGLYADDDPSSKGC